MKTLYYWNCYKNFGDELNAILFEKLFGIKFAFSSNPYEADIMAIGSILENCCISSKSIKRKIFFDLLRFLVCSKKWKKLEVFGSGFQYWKENYKIKYLRKMDFKIIRGKLSEQSLINNGLLKANKVLLGDLGLLSSYMFDKKTQIKEYKLGIVPHLGDLNSAVIFDIYKRCKENACLINVQNDCESVIRQIAKCDYIIASSLHGLIVSDSFGIPNLWFHNTLAYPPLDFFKYLDYYSIYDIDNVMPINILDLADASDIPQLVNSLYRIKKEKVEEKQRELFRFLEIEMRKF